MDIREMFGPAVWVGAPDPVPGRFYLLRGRFSVRAVKRAALRVVGLGYFECFLNGARVGADRYLPLNTDYEPRGNYPPGETLTGHRLYVPEYDVTSLLRDGENVLLLHFGGGWYDRPNESRFGDAKAIWRVFGEDGGGAFDRGSSAADRIAESFIIGYDFTHFEAQDLRLPCADAVSPEFDDGAWAFAAPARAPRTVYAFSDCPPDRVCGRIEPVRLTEENGAVCYDCGVNLTGTPVLRLTGAPGETVTVVCSEERTESGAPDPAFSHGQRAVFLCGGRARDVRLLFTWFGFRYFSVEGPARVLRAETVHTDVRPAAEFSCTDETLTWIDRAFRTTQLMNMHGGIPSDCPHLERRGYTGDGELACRAAMTVLDAEAFYRKWIRDILDCQDTASGHVQYTAPYIRSGGGPGGWGCAVAEVPYQFYLRYGDEDVLRESWPAVLRYFDYLEAHTENGLVVSDKPGEWCLGDWCTPEAIVLPAPFINNYFYVRTLLRAEKIAALIGREAELPMLRARIGERKAALTAAYFNAWDGNFLGCRQGANAFAADIGLGDERTYRNTVEYYRRTGGYDTGIFGTDVVTRVLFERGDGDLAVDLLSSKSLHAFGEMRRRGATTLWEYFPGSLRDRSHSHPMFGAVTAYLYEYLLGIRQPEGEAGFRSVEIAPALVPNLNGAAGSRELRQGAVAVSWARADGTVRLTVTLPPDLPGTLLLNGNRLPLHTGENTFVTE